MESYYRKFRGSVDKLEGYAFPIKLTTMILACGLFGSSIVFVASYTNSHPSVPEVEDHCTDSMKIVKTGGTKCSHSQHKMSINHNIVGKETVLCTCQERNNDSL